MTTIDQLKETMSKELYGISRSDAISKGVCISCGQPALSRCTSIAGRKEYRISGLCEVCFDAMFEEK